jgi:peptide/nickel transport system permease protein
MLSFVRRRMYTSAIPLIIVLLGVFLLARLTGDPTSLYLPESATEAQRAAFAEKNGFNDSIWTQLVDYFKGVAHLDFGTSLRTGESASDMALRAFPATLQLAFATMVLAILGAIVIGCWAAYRPNSVADRFSSLLSMTAASIPDFWFAITGVWLFAVLMGWLPTSGTDAGMLSWILPVATLMIRPLGVLTQVVRGAMVSALSAPYVRLARSKGASDLRVVTHHALRNAAAPALTVAGDLAVGLINGAVVVEAIFGWPGIGKLMIDAILQRDFAVLQAAVLLTAVSIFVLNILIDACYALLDARVREPARV